MKLLVSIHDVAPANEVNVRALWSMCTQRGITPALLVVPRWHGGSRLDSSPHFVEWLKSCAASGAEIFLHGERHDEVGLPRNLRHELRALGRTDSEGEFLTLNRADARDRIRRGLTLLRHLGFQVVGFVAPAWLTTTECDAAVRDCGLAISEDASGITVHRARTGTRTRMRSPVLRWSTRTRARALLSVIVAEARWRARAPTGVTRIALHPGDLDDAMCARSVARSLARWSAVSEKSRYADL